MYIKIRVFGVGSFVGFGYFNYLLVRCFGFVINFYSFLNSEGFGFRMSLLSVSQF